MNREDFPILNSGIIYFDNGATSLKPRQVIEKMKEYYFEYPSNVHRGDYGISLKADAEYLEARKLVKEFLHAEKSEEIIFTSGTTDSLNRVVFGYMKQYLKENDEVILTKSEHASNILPWFELEDQIGIKVTYLELGPHHEVTLEQIKKQVNDRTKVISFAHVTNVLGDVRPIKEITKFAHEKGILVVVDGAQSVPHMRVDVKDLDVDFLAFSGHKMCGPTGIGVLYGKENLLEKMNPISFGGGMNAMFLEDGTREYEKIPTRFEAGTPPISEAIGLGEAIRYLMNIGMDQIYRYEKELKTYAVSKLKEIPEIEIYNEETDSGIISFNYKDIFAQDLAIYLDHHHICVRAGSHCAKILKEELGKKNTCRISFSFYNTKEEIDELIRALKNPHIKEELF